MKKSKTNKGKIWYANLHKKILSEFGIKITYLRSKMLEFILGKNKPFRADDVLDSILDTGVNKTTIYRNLYLFLEKGLLREVDMRRDSVFYEYVGVHHHHHIICTECDCIEDFHICDEKDLVKGVLDSSKNFKSITDHSFEIFGVCKKCS